MEQQTHFFFAVKLPDEIKLRMKEHLEKLKSDIPFSRWVHYQDLHITLAFIGFAPTEKLERATDYVTSAIKGFKSIKLSIHRLGCFGNVHSPRVFWADTQASEELNHLRQEVFSACERAGFQLETRPFRPHITLARKWAGGEPFNGEWLHVWKKIQPDPLTFEAKEVVLYQTHLQKLPKYEAKILFPLN